MAEAAERLRPLIAKRGQLKAQITRFLSFSNNVENNDNIRLKLEITTRLEKIELVWDQFSNIQSDIEILDDSDAQRKEGEFFEEQYFSVVSKAKELLAEFQETKTNANTDQSGWQSFHDAFEALVNRDKSLSNTQKFMYLNSRLEGEAASITESLIVTDDNYVIAWDLLRNRYENKRAILNAHINALLDLPVIVKESHLGLRKLIDTFLKNLRALKNFGLATDTWDQLLINILTRKLDDLTKREWEKSIKPKEIPNVNEFINYLTNKCQILESLESQNKSLNVKSNTCVTNVVDDTIINRFSSFVKLQRVVAYCLRFKLNTTIRKKNKLSGNLNIEELKNATLVLITITGQLTGWSDWIFF
ncbi:hypothetical protein NQ318_012731 [Aromia moschata]|uniref:Uncharacterized protein n=1 Tax=Aromia moschata TaxID=1265417 RepID=A0AAV8XQD1_9CUCU|nr:hypothetical protein NQ318_012731 [Aromia moschata]